ncbi:glutamic acid-rich protein-like [Senna tora]|uniref:Glutamic acid-rich protein-like n=1 Tax=Senna tora TaxID=362788 RepID=A0A834SYI8_9FABA|nr:glutamic acid-rich protein-like [Senna tora]
MMKNHKDLWKRHGCSIMSDGWSSRTNRSLINFLVNCSAGTMFVKSVDASSYVKTAEKVYKLLDEFVEYVVKTMWLVDNEKKPAMSYIYEAMDRAKEAIQKSFNYREEKHRDIFDIIDER